VLQPGSGAAAIAWELVAGANGHRVIRCNDVRLPPFTMVHYRARQSVADPADGVKAVDAS
jgi:hypothetical protein